MYLIQRVDTIPRVLPTLDEGSTAARTLPVKPGWVLGALLLAQLLTAPASAGTLVSNGFNGTSNPDGWTRLVATNTGSPTLSFVTAQAGASAIH